MKLRRKGMVTDGTEAMTNSAKETMPQGDAARKWRDPYDDPEPLAIGPWCCDRSRLQMCACLEHQVCRNCGDGLVCLPGFTDVPDEYPIACDECGNPNRENWRECARTGCATTRKNQEEA